MADIVMKQFKTCVLPAMEYGVGIWGVGAYNTLIWKQLETFWTSIARSILGVSSLCPIAGIQGELEWLYLFGREQLGSVGRLYRCGLE